jgi:membrane associated rhomboid family serine protease
VLPLKDTNPTTRIPWVTYAIIAANVIVFLFWQPTFASGTGGDVRQQLFFFCHAEIPWEVTHRESLVEGGQTAVRAIDQERIGLEGRALLEALRDGVNEPGSRIRVPGAPAIPGCPHKSWWESVFVAMFLHGGWLHIGGNMLYLWIFGNNVEDKIGPLFFVLFYFIGGIAASAAQIATSPDSVVPTLGASGAIAAVLGAYLVMFPRRRVLTAVFFFLIALIELPAVVVLGFWFVLQFLSGATSVTEHITGGVAYFAHIGGFVLGVLVALLFFPKERRPPAELYRPLR